MTLSGTVTFDFDDIGDGDLRYDGLLTAEELSLLTSFAVNCAIQNAVNHMDLTVAGTRDADTNSYSFTNNSNPSVLWRALSSIARSKYTFDSSN